MVTIRAAVRYMIVMLSVIAAVIATPVSAQGAPTSRDCTGVTFPYTMTGNTPAELITAIECANANGTADTIDLNGQTVILTAVYASYSGDTGLPQITSTVTLQDGTISRSGDTAFRLLGVDGTGNLTLNTVTLSNGIGAIDSGGAVFNNFGTLTVLNSTITGNSAASFGGAIASTGTLTITTSTISGNEINSFGGGISTTGTATITNSLITGNTATYGGGIHNDGSLTVVNSTLAGNYADNTGGSIFNADVLLLQNTVSYGNEATTTNEISGVYTATNSLVGVDPLFVAPLDASDTAPTTGGDYHLQPGSPAIDAGDNVLVPVGITTDIDGDARIIITIVDIGADEVNYCAPFVFPYTMTSASADELITAIECANFNATADTINLNGQTVALTDSYADYGGATGLPLITSVVTLANGVITRSGTNEFRLLSIDGGADVSLDGITLSNGKSVSSWGGAVSNFGTITVVNSVVVGNTATSFGGGIYNFGTLTVTDSVIIGNSVNAIGGGIASFGSATVTNSLITGNRASYGGAVYNEDNLTLNNVSIAGNYAENVGGGVHTSSVATLNNTLVFGNEAGLNSPELYGTGTVTTNSSLIGVDPLFVAPLDASDNAPTTAGDYHLQPGSPAIDTGDNALVPAGVTLDLDGNPRISSGTVDMGAYEFQVINLLTNPGFEAGTAPWDVISLGKDKVKAKNPFEGAFAFRFKGFAGKTSAKAKQTVVNPPIVDGQSFVLTAQINSGVSAIGKFILKVTTDLGSKFKLKLDFDQAGVYALHEVVVPVTLAGGETVTKAIVIVTDKSQSGKVYLDAVSLTVDTTPAPRTETRSGVLPPPAAPASFRGQN